MSDKKIVSQFTMLTFLIAYGVSGMLIVLGQFGYRVYGLVSSLQQFAMNIPFALLYLFLSCALFISAYSLWKNHKDDWR